MSKKSDMIVKEIFITVAAITVILIGYCIWNYIYPRYQIPKGIMACVISFEIGICFGKLQEFTKLSD